MKERAPSFPVRGRRLLGPRVPRTTVPLFRLEMWTACEGTCASTEDAVTIRPGPRSLALSHESFLRTL